jgi:hypothetical protein
LPRTIRLISAWSGCTSLSSSVRASGGGRHGSPLKQYLATSASRLCRPVASNLLDNDKSLIIQLLKFLYKGLVFSSLPTAKITLSHQVIVDVPSKSGSIPVLILEINFDANLGWSSKLLKNRNTAFYASI